MFTPEMYEESGSRFTDRVEFTIGVGGEPDQVEAALAIIETAPMKLTPFASSEGRGAEAGAAGAVLEAVMYIGAVYGGGQAIVAAWHWLRDHVGERVTLSHGALKRLVQFEILRNNPELSEASVVVLSATETMTAHDLNHTGLDMMTLVLGTTDNTRSWCYLVNCHGKILHASSGGPFPKENLYSHSGITPDWDKPNPDLPSLGG